jgi:hypothetical protein
MNSNDFLPTSHTVSICTGVSFHHDSPFRTQKAAASESKKSGDPPTAIAPISIDSSLHHSLSRPEELGSVFHVAEVGAGDGFLVREILELLHDPLEAFQLAVPESPFHVWLTGESINILCCLQSMFNY